jgi:hypothetical protein
MKKKIYIWILTDLHVVISPEYEYVVFGVPSVMYVCTNE